MAKSIARLDRRDSRRRLGSAKWLQINTSTGEQFVNAAFQVT
jgi:hypothetical protein